MILAKDEEGAIGEVVRGSKDHASRVIVVDGQSSDNTKKVAEESGAEVISDHGLGKGDGYRTGIAHLSGLDDERVIVFLDADGSHNTDDIPKLAAPILAGELDMVIASRMKGGSDELEGSFSNFVRNFGGNLMSTLVSWRFGVKLTDVLNGFRAMSAKCAATIELKAVDFDIEHEMAIKAIKAGFRIGEIPSHEFARKAGKSKLPTYSKAHKFFIRLFINFF